MKLVFDVELVNEMDGSFMNFEYEVDVWDEDMSEEDIDKLISDMEIGADSEIYDAVMSNLSIVPRFSYKED